MDKHIISPSDESIPRWVVEVIATWPSLREHPAWKGHKIFETYEKLPKVIGWDLKNKPIYAKPHDSK